MAAVRTSVCARVCVMPAASVPEPQFRPGVRQPRAGRWLPQGGLREPRTVPGSGQGRVWRESASSACRRDGDVAALSWRAALVVPRAVTPFALLPGGVTEEGGRPRGSLVRHAAQQPGRRCVYSPPLPGGRGLAPEAGVSKPSSARVRPHTTCSRGRRVGAGNRKLSQERAALKSTRGFGGRGAPWCCRDTGGGGAGTHSRPHSARGRWGAGT